MAAFQRHNIREWLIEEIENSLADTGMTERQFCDDIGNVYLLRQLREGKSPRIDTMERILKKIDGAEE